MALQLPETEIAVAGSGDWCPPGRRRRGAPLRRFLTKASVAPLVSPPTMFDASDRKPTQVGLRWKPPLMAGMDEGPLAGAPLRVREMRTVRAARHLEPLLPIGPLRRTAKTSCTPLVSPRTMSLACDSNAIARAKRLSFEMTGCVDGPFGILPSYAREISVVYWRSERRLAVAVAGMAATAASTAARIGANDFTLPSSAPRGRTLIPHPGYGRFTQASKTTAWRTASPLARRSKPSLISSRASVWLSRRSTGSLPALYASM